MRDRRDFAIAALAAALLFCVGILLGQSLGPVLPAATAQDTLDPEQPINVPTGGAADTGSAGGGGVTITTNLDPRAGQGRTGTAPTASDSDSNNRFVAVTCPIGSGESVLFLLDSESEQVTVYRYRRNKGLEFLAGRKIDYDLKISGYSDISKYTRDEMARLFEKQKARAAAEALKGK